MVFRVDKRDFAAGDRVRMGSGETGQITEKVERNGMSGYRVKITDGPRKGSIVGASPPGMVKLGRRQASARAVVTLGTQQFLCRVAATAQQHRIGLEQTPSLDLDEGMLFVFDPPRAATFHMGAVTYPIDIVFVDQGRVAKVVHGAQPGSRTRWSHTHCEAVVELKAGQARAADVVPGGRYPAPPLDGQPGSHYEISFPESIDEENMDPDRFKDRGLPDDVSPNADAMSNDQWRNNYGYDALEENEHALRPTAQLEPDPVDFVVKLIEAMAHLDRPLDWHRDALNPALAYAVIESTDISRWLATLDVTGSESTDLLAHATDKNGLRLLGDGLVLAGVADLAHVAQDDDNNDILVLWTEHEDLHG